MKKLLFIPIAILSFFIANNYIQARSITINELNAEINNSDIFKLLEGDQYTYASRINTETNKIEIYQNDTKIMDMTYSDDYIEYSNDDSVTEDKIDVFFRNDAILLYGVMKNIFKLSGYDSKILKEDAYNNDIYEHYGLHTSTESYDYSGSDEYGSYHYSGEAIKYFKISLNTDKITALIREYGIDDPTNIKNLIKNLKPKITVGKEYEDEINLYPKVENPYNDDKVYCYIYRSKNKDSGYTKISDKQYVCDGTKITDKDLKDDRTYYYKAVVVGGNNFSDPVKAETKKIEKDDDDDDDEKEKNVTTADNNKDEKKLKNPDTGAFIPTIILMGLSIICIEIIRYTRKKKLFNKL